MTDSDDLASCVRSNITDLPELTTGRKISYVAKLFFYESERGKLCRNYCLLALMRVL